MYFHYLLQSQLCAPCLLVFSLIAFDVHAQNVLISYSEDNNNPISDIHSNRIQKAIIVLPQIKICSTNPNSSILNGAKWHVQKILQTPMSHERNLILQQIYENQSSEFSLYDFNLKVGEINCDENRLEVYNISLENLTRTDAGDPQWDQYELNDFYWSPDGHFKPSNFEYISSDNYCIDNITDSSIDVLVCTPNKTEGDIIIRKCCPMGMVIQLNFSNFGDPPECVETLGEEWIPVFERSAEILTSLKLGDYWPIPNYDQKPIEQNGKYFRYLTPNLEAPIFMQADLRILNDGTVQSRFIGNVAWDRPKADRKNYIQNFCIDGLINAQNDLVFRREHSNQVLLYHELAPRDENSIIYSHIYFVAHCIGATILLLVVVIHLLVWNQLNIHGWTKGALSLTIFSSTFFSAMTYGAGLFYNEYISQGTPSCIIIGILGQFFAVSTYTWMINLNFDVWSTLRSVRTPNPMLSKGKMRFLAYCLFGFGIPVLVVSISVGIEESYGVFDDRVIRPNYGRYVCTVDKSAAMTHVFIPNSILFTCALLFGCFTFKSLYRLNQETKVIRDCNTKMSRNQTRIALKLFILLGFSWTFEFLSYMVAGNDVTWYWAIFDLYNLFWGFGLFWIFICNKEIKGHLFLKYKFLEDTSHWIYSGITNIRQKFKNTPTPSTESSCT